jgi:hypothetical protein
MKEEKANQPPDLARIASEIRSAMEAAGLRTKQQAEGNAISVTGEYEHDGMLVKVIAQLTRAPLDEIPDSGVVVLGKYPRGS